MHRSAYEDRLAGMGSASIRPTPIPGPVGGGDDLEGNGVVGPPDEPTRRMEALSPLLVAIRRPSAIARPRPPDAEGVKRFFAMFRDAFPDIAVTIDELVADETRVAVATTITGTHNGELMGFAPTGRQVAVAGLDILRIDGGRIAEHRGLTDTVGLMRQLQGG